MALIRYPGSKEKLTDAIWAKFPDQIKHTLWSNSRRWEYREPFFGAGAIGFKVLRRLSSRCGVWLNDLDPGMVSLWRSVRECPEELIDRLSRFEPTAEMFYKFKDEDGRQDLPQAQSAFRKLALHRMSFSGLGFMAGGPIGGKDQENARYKVDCRWTPETMKEEVWKLHKRIRPFEDFRFTNLDYSALIEGAPRECFVYLDPPYYEKGPALYKHSMDDDAHRRLAELLRETEATWVLSYDDHPFVRDLYSWAHFETISLTYTMASTDKKRPKNGEVIITHSKPA